MNELLKPTIDWIVKDWRSNKIRFVVETIAWALSIGAAILFAVTVPNIPFVLYLAITVTSCGMYAWAAWTRRSFGMLANYMLLTGIDTVAFMKALAA
jgi:hypothetical protein